jgi:hypothetical protein
VEPEDTVVFRYLLGKHIPTATNLTTIIEQLPPLRNKNTYTFPGQRLGKHVLEVPAAMAF